MNAELAPEQRKKLHRAGPLAKLSPFLCADGILRMESRITADAYYSFDFRNPVILPKNNHVTMLVVLRFHQRYGHANVETVVNELR